MSLSDDLVHHQNAAAIMGVCDLRQHPPMPPMPPPPRQEARRSDCSIGAYRYSGGFEGGGGRQDSLLDDDDDDDDDGGGGANPPAGVGRPPRR
mmetsp:Transcript_28051/g.82508  ORF Transcript_28051/g.82508 Transcript_28051/m.82508 type:complete len:93 (+) Transcript_28051:174-452(+)